MVEAHLNVFICLDFWLFGKLCILGDSISVHTKYVLALWHISNYMEFGTISALGDIRAL